MLCALSPQRITWGLILWRNWIVVSKVKVTAKFQNGNECLSRYFLNHWYFYYQTWYGDVSLWARSSVKRIGLLSSRSRSQLWDKNNLIKIWVSNILSELLILLQLNLVWWYIIRRQIVFWKDWIALLWSRSKSRYRFRMSTSAGATLLCAFC